MLEPGKTLSHYRLGAMIGKGGMGEVWQATDARLDREVALKVLPDFVAQDQGRIDRFAREAKLLASLNHPGIATIFDVDEHEGIRFLVMELVPGDDLAQALERGPLPLTEALDVALQIVRAIEAAHGQSVVHRDLKPANVKRTPDGKIKVLDFGLAKTMEPEPSSGGNVAMSPTVTSAGTVAGMILGTAAYMSPEQARGRPIDKRTDVWSFGVLLYELLTGDNPFRGDTVADSVGAIMHRDPDLEVLPPQTPSAIRRLLRRCLTRERSDRLHDIGDARIEIEEAIANPEVQAPPGEVVQVSAPPAKLPWVALAVLVPLAGLAGWWIGARDDAAAPPPSRRFELVPDLEVQVAVVSPDGTRIAYKVENEILIRSLDSLESRVLTADAVRGRADIFWSPDGRSLGVSHGTEITRIDLDGGAPRILTGEDTFISNPIWGEDGFIYFAAFQGGINRLPDSGGASEEIIVPDEQMVDFHGLTMLPEGRGFLTLPHLMKEEFRTIFFERPGEARRAIYTSDSLLGRVFYSATGHVLFDRQDNPRGLWALPFSLDRLEATGPPFLVEPDLVAASFSANGDMVYSMASVETGRDKQQIVWADRTGEIVERLEMDLFGAMGARASPDGSKIAVIARGIGRPSTERPSLWVIDLDRRTSTKLTEVKVVPSPPSWSEDGTRMAFISDAVVAGSNAVLASVRSDGTGDRKTLLDADIKFFADVDRTWAWAAFMTGSMNGENGFGITVQQLGDDSTRRTFVDGPAHDSGPVIHPGGKWIAYMSGDFRAMDTFVRPFPDGEGQWKVSVGSGGGPFWSVDGQKLYYTREDDSLGMHLMEVAFDGSGDRPVLGTPTELFTLPRTQLAIGPDGRFVYVLDVEPEDGEAAPDNKGIVVVENWWSRFAE